VPFHAFGLLPVGFVVIGGFFVLRGLGGLRADRRRRASWLTFPGRVVGSRTVSGGDSTDQTQCQVAYLRDGHEVVFWNRFTSTMVRSPHGRVVEVLVNPHDAGDAVVSRGLAGGGTMGVALTLVGALAVVVGLVVGAHVLLR
jgi:hypothetical protein